MLWNTVTLLINPKRKCKSYIKEIYTHFAIILHNDEFPHEFSPLLGKIHVLSIVIIPKDYVKIQYQCFYDINTKNRDLIREQIYVKISTLCYFVAMCMTLRNLLNL